MEVQSGQDDTNGRIEGFARSDGGVISGLHVAAEGGICTANVGDVFGVEFGFNAGFTEDEDGALGRGQRKDARDVDCGAVGGAEDFVL